MPRDTRIDPKEVLATLDELPKRPFVSAAEAPSPFCYELSQTPGCVDRIDAVGNRVTGRFENGELVPEQPCPGCARDCAKTIWISFR